MVAPANPRHGLARLPEPSINDIYLDLEGGSTPEGTLQYIWGVGTLGGRGAFYLDQYRALTEADEKAALEKFLDLTYARHQADPTVHVYHYGNYELTWLRSLVTSTRLMS